MSEKEVGTVVRIWKSDSTTHCGTVSSSVLLNTYQRLTTMNGLRRWNLANIDASYFTLFYLFASNSKGVCKWHQIT